MADNDGLKETLDIAFMDLDLNHPDDWLSVQDRNRPYHGQPHTHHGERGKTLLEGITYRDVADCFIVGAFLASDIPEEERGSIYAIDWNEIDVVAVIQATICELEKRQGIYPNVPKLEINEDSE